MKRLPHPALFLAAGLGFAEILFSVVVFHSDLALYHTMSTLSRMGYLTVPNAHVLPTLEKISTALCGGVFFTLTVGAGLCLLALFATWIGYRIFGGNRLVLIIIIGLWNALVIRFNANGFNPPATAAAVLIPFCVFLLYRQFLVRTDKKFDWISGTVHIVVLLVLAGAWFSVANRSIFINIRDYVLMSNPVGQKINTFYYRYTLYPAEVFKSLDQKLIKTCTISGTESSNTIDTVESTLRRFDYLPVGSSLPVDMVVRLNGSSLIFSHAGEMVETASLSRFQNNPGAVLKIFSNRCDTDRFLRRFTYYSLLVALPLMLYIGLHGLFSLLFLITPSERMRSVTASCLCLALGLLFVFSLYRLPTTNVPENQIQQKLTAPDWQDRRAALKTITELDLDPLQFHLDPGLMKSPHAPVRYWLASALGNSRKPKAFDMLMKLVSDPQPNVECMAYYGLGRLGNSRAISAIRARFLEIKQAYTQWYAYKALKRLGWTQSITGSHLLR